jgi:Cu-Zn family superoxide dismutase
VRKNVSALLAAIAVTTSVAGCGTGSPKTAQQSPAVAEPSQLASAQFAAPAASGPQPPAITYDPALIPSSATGTIAVASADNKTKVTLAVKGLPANHEYGAHVHTKQCGPQPADSGPHYQDKNDPVTPSTDPAYANAKNEVWLDFMTDAQGDASVASTVDWKFRPGGANSVVIHAMHTATEQGKAGTAGNRLACITAAFSG